MKKLTQKEETERQVAIYLEAVGYCRRKFDGLDKVFVIRDGKFVLVGDEDEEVDSEGRGISTL